MSSAILKGSNSFYKCSLEYLYDPLTADVVINIHRKGTNCIHRLKGHQSYNTVDKILSNSQWEFFFSRFFLFFQSAVSP